MSTAFYHPWAALFLTKTYRAGFVFFFPRSCESETCEKQSACQTNVTSGLHERGPQQRRQRQEKKRPTESHQTTRVPNAQQLTCQRAHELLNARVFRNACAPVVTGDTPSLVDKSVSKFRSLFGQHCSGEGAGCSFKHACDQYGFGKSDQVR